MNIVLIGLSSSGKSTLFTSFTGNAGSAGSGKAQVGIVMVPDRRLDELSELYHPKKTTFTSVNFRDTLTLDIQAKHERIALFDSIRTADALAFVVGGFRCATAQEVCAEVKKLRFELIIEDLDFVTKRIERIERELKSSQNGAMKKKELELLARLQGILEKEGFVYGTDFNREEQALLAPCNLPTLKPSCYVVNVAEGSKPEETESLLGKVRSLLEGMGDHSPVLAVNALLESEIAEMTPLDMAAFLKEFGIEEQGRHKVIRTAYELMRLITFFTVGEDECRSWQIRQGDTALDAAAAIHSDLARGFIRAEVIEYDTLLKLGSLQEAKKAGKLRLEGKTYTVQDGEIVHIMFNV
jgi:ribosome-binding ATPase